MTLRAKESKARVQRLRQLTDAQDLIEYALLIGLISTTVLIAVSQLGAKVPGMYSTTAAALPGGPAAEDPGDQEPADDGPGNGNPGNGNPGNGNPGNSKPVGNPGGGKGK